MSIEQATASTSTADSDLKTAAAWRRRLGPRLDRARGHAYAGFVVAATFAILLVEPGTEPSPEPAYAPLGVALLSGVLISVRLAPGQPGTSLLLIPALAADARFGLAALPAVLFASFVGSLVRRVRGPALFVTAAHNSLVFAVAHFGSHAVSPDPLTRLLTFALIFSVGEFAVWRIARWVVGPRLSDRNVARPDAIVSLALAPLAGLPLLAWARFGDGGLLLALAALLAVLAVVAEARSLATARAEAEAERDRLARAHTLQQDLVHLITHELKTPITTVLVYAQLAEKALRTDALERLPTQVTRIQQAARGLERLVDNLVEMSRLEEAGDLPPAEPVDVAVLAREVSADLEPLAEHKRLVLRVEVGARIPSVRAPPFLLREALSNLVSNAIKYTPEGGEVRIWAEMGSPHGGTVVLGVSDTGIGLSEEDIARVFSRFFRSADPRARAERGSGLGLALTHAIIARIGGRIEVDSRLNHGTTFRVVLPRTGQ